MWWFPDGLFKHDLFKQNKQMSHFKQNEHEKVFFINGRYYPLLVFATCQSDELANGGRNGLK